MNPSIPLSQSLSAAGIRVTPQRLAVYEVLCESGGHLSAETIFQRVRAAQPSLSLATVYRTLEMLRDAGLAVEGRLGDSRNFYETNVEPHFHLVCIGCHTVRDLDPEQAVQLQREVAERSGYRIRWSRLEFYGSCADCLARESRDAAR
jgi:Fur family transcriptional regulator, peroxide stress response regulator